LNVAKRNVLRFDISVCPTRWSMDSVPDKREEPTQRIAGERSERYKNGQGLRIKRTDKVLKMDHRSVAARANMSVYGKPRPVLVQTRHGVLKRKSNFSGIGT
jgi:hypothetical protein